MKATKKYFLFVALLLGASSAFAQQQSGQIHGVVRDSSSREGLAGANVLLKGTSLGASTNLDGAFVIRSVPPGSYTLEVRYVGYRGKAVQVELSPGGDIARDFSLTIEAIEGQEIVVQAQARGQIGAINQQLASNTIINVVSAERIRELPDASAAAALSRLPGVSIMNGEPTCRCWARA